MQSQIQEEGKGTNKRNYILFESCDIRVVSSLLLEEAASSFGSPKALNSGACFGLLSQALSPLNCFPKTFQKPQVLTVLGRYEAKISSIVILVQFLQRFRTQLWFCLILAVSRRLSPTSLRKLPLPAYSFTRYSQVELSTQNVLQTLFKDKELNIIKSKRYVRASKCRFELTQLSSQYCVLLSCNR